MSISRLDLYSIRNLQKTSLNLSGGFNLIFGDNGSGKTSFLETIYLLSHGRSFRTNHIKRVVCQQEDKFSLFAHVTLKNKYHQLGMEKNKDGSQRLRLDGQNCQSISVFSRLMPTLLINPDAFRLLEAGPSERRQFIDWGVFHVEHDFLETWQRWKRCLAQRNAALKMGNGVEAWNDEFLQLSLKIDNAREHYLRLFIPEFTKLLGDFHDTFPIVLKYRHGWNKEKSLEEALSSSKETERIRGYTQVGPHRADLSIEIKGIPAVDVLSRGQQKLLVIVCKLAQGVVLRKQAEKTCLYLIDDLASELDIHYMARISSLLKEMGSQIFLTSISAKDLSWAENFSECKWFHVKHGLIQPIEMFTSELCS